MTLPAVALKRKHHRLLLCEDGKKQDLLTKLIFENEGRSIAVVLHDDDEPIYVPSEATLIKEDDDAEGRTFDLLITYDLPADPEAYFERLSLAQNEAVTLFGTSDQSRLLGIEAALGRAIKQETVEGYSPKTTGKIVKKSPQKKRPQVASGTKNTKATAGHYPTKKPQKPMLRIKAEALRPKQD